MSGLFISYRQDDTRAWAALLRDRLAESFGEDQVFLAVDTLGPGMWREQIHKALQQAQVVLVLMGREWLAIKDARGERRLWEPDDVHRQEIEVALASSATVIPVLVDNAAMPAKENLPAEIAGLAELQARPLSNIHRHRTTDLETLIADIETAGLHRIAGPIGPGFWQHFLGFASGTLRLLLITLVTSVVLLVAAQVALGWTFPPEQISVITLIIFISLVVSSRAQARFRRGTRYAKD